MKPNDDDGADFISLPVRVPQRFVSDDCVKRLYWSWSMHRLLLLLTMMVLLHRIDWNSLTKNPFYSCFVMDLYIYLRMSSGIIFIFIILASKWCPFKVTKRSKPNKIPIGSTHSIHFLWHFMFMWCDKLITSGDPSFRNNARNVSKLLLAFVDMHDPFYGEITTGDGNNPFLYNHNTQMTLKWRTDQKVRTKISNFLPKTKRMPLLR